MQETPCNCRNKESCPLNGYSNISATSHKATVKQTPLAPSPSSAVSNLSAMIANTNNIKTHCGYCEPHFKARYNNHTHPFRNSRKANSTELSKFYWNSINNGYQPRIEWSVHSKSFPYRCGSGRCHLWLCDKFVILTKNSNRMLNKRFKIISKFRHRNKFILRNFKIP